MQQLPYFRVYILVEHISFHPSLSLLFSLLSPLCLFSLSPSSCNSTRRNCGSLNRWDALGSALGYGSQGNTSGCISTRRNCGSLNRWNALGSVLGYGSQGNTRGCINYSGPHVHKRFLSYGHFTIFFFNFYN